MKLENEVAQSQIKSLKDAMQMNGGKDSTALENELKQQKLKAKRYENVLKRSVRVLTTVGSEIVKRHPQDQQNRDPNSDGSSERT